MRSVKIAGGAVALVVVLVAVGGYVYFFSGLRSTPKPLALASASPRAASPAASGSPAGTWVVASGSTAGYRATEQFVGQPSTHEAVARTSDVSGGMTITGAGATLLANGVKLTVQLASLKSQDTVAGRDVADRDQVVQRALDVSTHPTATLTAGSVALPAGASGGGEVSLAIPAQLTIHGTTRPVTVTAQGRFAGDTRQVAGTIPVTMTDYGVEVPHFPFVTVQPKITLEFQATFTRQAP